MQLLTCSNTWDAVNLRNPVSRVYGARKHWDAEDFLWVQNSFGWLYFEKMEQNKLTSYRKDTTLEHLNHRSAYKDINRFLIPWECEDVT